jgi:hypothetical protein
MKECKKCNKVKNLDMFHKNKQSRDGVMHYCKECQSRKDRKIPYQEIVAFEFYE